MSKANNLEWLSADVTQNLDEDLFSEDFAFKGIDEESARIEVFRSNVLSSIRIKSANIQSIAISLKALYMLTSDKQVLRWLLNESLTAKEVKKDSLNELIIRGGNPAQQRPERIFCDSNGWHCLVTFNTDDTHYFHLSSNSSLLISKLHGYKVLSVGWSRNTERYISKEVLIGTNKGNIIELLLDYDSTSDTIKQTLTKVYDLSYPIFGIEYIVLTGLPCKISVIVACPNHLYHFIGDPNEQGKPGFTEIFNEYRKNPALLNKSFVEFAGNSTKTQLQLYYSEYVPNSFVVMSTIGLSYSKLPSSSAEKLNLDSLIAVENPKSPENIIGVGITKHHLYFFSSYSLNIVSKITQKVVHTIDFEKRQGYELVGTLYDDRSHSLIVWSGRFIYQILIENEEKDVWKHYIEKNQYDEAILFCEQINSPAYSKVKGMHADFLYKTGRYIESAQAYVKSEKTFEEITLRLIENPKALQVYLETKLKSLPVDMKSQKCLLCTWLLEIYLDDINQNFIDRADDTQEELKLQNFLEVYKADLHEETTCFILQSHGRIDDWVYYAELIKKYEMVILHHINQSEFKKALDKLKQVDPNGREALLCKHAPVFMKAEPKKVVEMLMEVARLKKGQIDFKKILPALMNVDHSSRDEAIKFEYFLIKEMKIKDKPVNNLYLFHLSESEGEKSLIDYLKFQETLIEITFDTDYALSVFKRSNKIESLIYLYSIMKMHSEAVTLALENRKLDLAKQNAKKPAQYDEELSRRLWLQIAIYHIKMNNAREALLIMNESRLIKMEDLLPYFDDQGSISNFKDDICKALKSYKDKIEELNNELNESKGSSELVKRELKTIKERCIEIEGMHPCEICGKPVMKYAFYVFPCSHAYHRECLLELIMPMLKKKDLVRYNKILNALEDIKYKESGDKKNGKNVEIKDGIKELYRRLNQLLAPQCFFCSANFIETIYDELIEDKVEEGLWMIESLS